MVTVSQIVENGAVQVGITLPNGAAKAFETYYEFLEQQRKKFNLTAITGAEDVARLHFLDSLALLGSTDFKKTRMIDVGSGAGFPGIPLKLAEPSIDLTLIDASKKRVAFLSDLCEVLDIAAVCVHARAEELSRQPDMREQFDIAASRAVARLNMLCELCLPLVRVGGVFLAMKGIDSEEESREAGNVIKKLGAEPHGIVDYVIPETDIKHRIIIIKKTSPTPDEYPRRFAKIKKR